MRSNCGCRCPKSVALYGASGRFGLQASDMARRFANPEPILFLVKEERPFRFFGALFPAMAFIAIVLVCPLIVTFFRPGWCHGCLRRSSPPA